MTAIFITNILADKKYLSKHVALAEKVEMKGVERLEKETGIRLDTSGDRSKVVGTIFELPTPLPLLRHYVVVK